ncbi:unnamed protein product [Heterobilharzia americana]|nr:unnamed protein product [Heterobilharzia americana]
MCTFLMRASLLLVNSLVAMSAIVVTAFGAILTWGKSDITKVLNDVIGPLIYKLYGEEVARDFTGLASNILKFTSPFGLVFFILGVVSLAISLFGFCGTSCKSRACLKTYIGLLLVLVIIEITSMSFYYADRESVFKLVRSLAKESLTKYHSISSNDTDSMILSVLMPTLNCCGLVNGSDFDEAPNFQRNVIFNQQSYDLKYPIACCKMDSSFVIVDPTCPSEFNEKNSNVRHGCWTKLRSILGYYTGIAAIAGVIVLLFQLLLVIVSSVILTTRHHFGESKF